MKKMIFSLLLMAISLNAQNFLSPKWKIKTGDDITWALADFNDSDWEVILAGKIWEDQGFDNYDGFAWYRQTVTIPAKMKSLAKDNGGFILKLGKIDDSDEVYFNGELIGKHGQLPPSYKSAYGVKRLLEIPIEKILWDQPNVIAVRVYDAGGGGGIYQGPVEFCVKGMEDLFQIEPQFIQSNQIYLGYKKIVLPVKLSNQFKGALKGKLSFQLNTDFGDPVLNKAMNININGKSTKVVKFSLGKLDPGFYKANLSFEGTNENKNIHFNIGVNPEEIVSPLDRPADLNDYWRRAKKELAAVEPQYKLIKQDDKCTPDRDVYLVEMRSLGNVLVRGWFITPTKPGKYPAILHVQGYSTNMIPEWCYSGNDAVAFGLNVRGHGSSRDNVNPGFPGYLQCQVHDKEMYIYRGAYMDCVRALDFICSCPEVDTTRICVEGGSQGGALSYATAALDHRIDLCVPHVPFLSDFKDYFTLVPWPGGEFANYVKENLDFGWDGVYNTLSYIDIKNLAPWIKVPVFMTIGLVDETCPPHINFAAYNQLTVPKEYHVYPNSGHGMPAEYNELKYNWIKKQFGME